MNRKVNTADWVGISGSHVLLLTPCIVFGVFVIPRLNIFLLIPLIILLVLSLASLNMVFLLDPGYVPVNSHPQQHAQSLADYTGQSLAPMRQGDGESLDHLVSLPEEYPFVQAGHYGMDRVISVDGRNLDCKYCFTCQSLRPPRTYHCGSCDRCIYRHDHHCPWTGNCIGYRNYRFFFLFVINTCVLTWFVFISTLVEFIQSFSDSHTVEIRFESVLLCIYSFLIGISLGYLGGYHCYLVYKNLTTHEQIRGRYTNRLEVERGAYGNPFDKGVWRNIRSILIESRNPQLVNFEFWNQNSPKES